MKQKPKIQQTLRRMKLLALFLLLGLCSVHAVTHGQEARIDLTMSNVTLGEVFQRIEQLTDYMFVYRSEDVVSQKPISVNARQVTVKEVLAECLLNTGLKFVFKDNVIVIQREEQNLQEEKKVLTVKGYVYDMKKQPLPGVTITVVGTTVGTVTNANGWFSMDLPLNNGTLEFSFVGYKKQQVAFSESTDTLKIVLEEDVVGIDEVVVTGYGNISKGNYTGASTTVRAEDIMMAGVSSIDQMLQGVIPGMLVMNKTGMVGASPKIRVRGTSTLLGSQEPVWVVDGVVQRNPQPFSSDENTQFSMDADDISKLAGNAISWLNPNDIETITVLKDASATAIYGSQAANGVIVITTKKAKVGKVQVSYSGDFSIGQRPRYGLYDLMNSAERMHLSKEMYEGRRQFTSTAVILPIGYEGLLEKLLNKEITLDEMNEEYRIMSEQNTDWFDILFRNSFNHSHNLSISGGSDVLQNRTSFSYTQEKGEAKGNDVTQFAGNSNTTVRLWDRLTANMLLNASIREVNGFAYGVDPFNYAYNTSRVIPVYNEDGSYYFHEKVGTNVSHVTNNYIYNYNILNELENTGSESKTRTWSATLDLKLELLPGLEYQGLFSYASSSSDTKQYASEKSFYITDIRGYEYGSVIPNGTEEAGSRLPMGGILQTSMTNVSTITVRNSLVYDRLFVDKHRMTLQLGLETSSSKTKGETNTRYGYMPDRGETFATPPLTYLYRGVLEYDNTEIAEGNHSVINRISNTLSGYGTAVYTYDDRYVVNLSARIDASNRFGQDKNKRYEPTWSVGFKWRLGNESFAKGTWWLNSLDAYGSYGYQGNAVSTVSPELITTNSYMAQYKQYALIIKSLPYPDLGWEKTKTWNFGLEGAILDGRLNFTFDYFRKTSYVLSEKDIAYENGVANGIVDGTVMHNNGYDFIVDIVPVRMKDFTWQLSLNTSVAKNSVEKNNRVNTLDDYLNGEAIVNDTPFSTFYSYEFDGLNEENGQPNFKNLDVEGAENPLGFLVESGKFTPDFSGGFNTMFKYKNISLYALFALQWGGHDRLPALYPATTSYNGLPKPEQNVSKQLKNRWREPGDDTDIPSLPGLTTDIEYVSIPATSTTAGVASRSRYVLYNSSSARVANTDFIRCRSLSLSYDFNGDWMKQAGISYFQLKASMTNPFMWVSDKSWNGMDPETGGWPTRRVTSLSLQVIF